MHSNTKAQHLPKSTALLYNLSYQLVLQPTAPGHILQIFLRVTIQNQICIAQWVIVDEIIQLRPLCHSHIQRILDSGAIDGNFSSIPEQQLHTSGIHIKLANAFIILHVRVLLKSCCSLCRSIYDFGFHLPRTPILNFPKKTNNPNPSPIGNKFGLFLFGPSGENRTHGLLNPIQARYQNCATPGYLFAFAAHSLISIPDFARFVKRFFQISDTVFTFYRPGFCPPKGCAKERYFQKSRYASSSSSSWIGVVSSGGAPNSTVAKASANTLSAPA